jgi:hypothetical protein
MRPQYNVNPNPKLPTLKVCRLGLIVPATAHMHVPGTSYLFPQIYALHVYSDWKMFRKSYKK